MMRLSLPIIALSLASTLRTSLCNDYVGNTTADGRANLTFTYNLLNLPETVTSGNTPMATYAAGQYTGYLPGSIVTLDYFTHPNNWQMPLYMRLDLGYQMDFTTSKGGPHPLEHSLTVGIFNVLNRHNPSMLSYDSDTKTWNQVSIFPVMPSINWRVNY